MGKALTDRPWLTVLMNEGDTPGTCANCQKVCRERQAMLGDAYGVYRGVCPHCDAINLLDIDRALRGYCSSEMYLCLPAHCEIKDNDWHDVLIARSCGCRTCKAKEEEANGKDQDQGQGD